MNAAQLITRYSHQPLSHQLLTGILSGYRRPNAKIMALKAQGMLQPVRKGLYIAGPNASTAKPENILLANHIFGPSYVSLETALAFHGLIPERVYTITSMTTKASRNFETPLGLFTYTRLPIPYYAFGLQIVRLGDDQQAILATPEKAVCDKIVTTAGVLIRSIRGARDYLLENLRMDLSALKQFDTRAINSWLGDAPKRESLEWIIKMVETL